MASEGRSDVRLAEIVAALSLAIDMGLGQPMEHVLRSTMLALHLADELGFPPEERAATYYVSLLAWVGCTADAHERARLFGDDIRFAADTYGTDLAGLPGIAFLLRHVGMGQPPLTKARTAAALMASGGRALTDLMRSSCQATALFAERLGLGHEVTRPLQHNFERWDGKGAPSGLKGNAIAPAMRVVHVCEIAEVAHRDGGLDAAIRIAKDRSGTHFDPEVAAIFCAKAPDLVGTLGDGPSWDSVIEADPKLDDPLSEDDLDRALEAVADFADLKSPYTLGHSRGVANLAAGAAKHLGLPAAQVTETRRAALVHDIGRLGISNSVWDKPGPLSHSETERVRLHPYLTERVLSRPPYLARLGRIAGLHHERLDGSGYHRALTGAQLGPQARLLAAADAYHAMLESRPHRAAKTPEEAAGELSADARAGRLDTDAVQAILAVAGHKVRGRPPRPLGLTPREIEVLIRIARGRSTRDIAAELHVSPKTVGNHVEHVYTKIGVSTRASAALWALDQGLLPENREKSP